MSRDWKLWCINQSWNQSYCEGKFLSHLRYVKKLTYCTSFCFHSWFYFLEKFVYVFSNIYIFKWDLLFKNLKIARKSSGFNSLADLNFFFYPCIHFDGFIHAFFLLLSCHFLDFFNLLFVFPYLFVSSCYENVLSISFITVSRGSFSGPFSGENCFFILGLLGKQKKSDSDVSFYIFFNFKMCNFTF